MLKRCFLILLLLCCPPAAQSTSAENIAAQTPGWHFFIVMPRCGVYMSVEREEDYEGASFPLYCGIASIYPDENRFIFTKMTDLPIRFIEEELRAIEQNGYFTLHDHGRPSIQVPVSKPDVARIFPWWARDNLFWAFQAFYGRRIPLKAVPRFTLTCRFNADVPLSDDCQQTFFKIDELFIPFTNDEMRRMERDYGE